MTPEWRLRGLFSHMPSLPGLHKQKNHPLALILYLSAKLWYLIACCVIY
jgi:hypothetical protein